MKLTLLTPTRNRPDSFALVEKWVTEQTIWKNRPNIELEWIVVNDGKTKYKYTMGQRVVLRKSVGKRHSLCQNIIDGLKISTGDLIFFLEDDDWTHPNYLEHLWRVWSHSRRTIKVLGLTHARYYNIRYEKLRVCGNKEHASLGATAIDKSAVTAAVNAARCGVPTLDLRLWRHARSKKWPIYLAPDVLQTDGRRLHVGLKCMPGEKGIGIGHRAGGRVDKKRAKIKNWMGTSYADIKPFMSGGKRAHKDTLPT